MDTATATSTHPTIAPATLSLEDTATYLNVSLPHVGNLAREGRLPGAFKLGRRWLVSRQVLDRLLADPGSAAAVEGGPGASVARL